MGVGQKCKYWKFVKSEGSVITWACVKCGHQIVVNSLGDSITKRTKCESCGHVKFKKEKKQDELSLVEEE